ncbi:MULTISPECIES: magnesium transporter CorA family protein [unclassified Aureispira]|uniref:magnesium transporter CorA family protein n=1 Tax=unclassified Aureispira TaxID=2649989 RepID=UPI0006972455|nr:MULTISPECIES: magnesium transporter CorA family protein [unclassified Aureispira]WMX16917.1 magnesium transporter CorA family protein [Aureispira sp. CCB-E]
MVRYFEKQKKGKLEELESLVSGCWVNISPPFNAVEIDQLAEQLDVPIDFLTDPLDIDERTRFEIEDDVKFIVVNTPALNEKGRDDLTLYITVPIGIIITTEHIVTISSYETAVMQKFIESKVRSFNPQDFSLFVLQILEQNVYTYLRCLKDINVRRNIIEKEVYESSQNKDLKRLLSLEKSLVYFVTALSSNALLKQKLQRMDLLSIQKDEEKADLLEDIMIDNSQAQEMAHIYTNILSNTMDALASMISNNLNEVMQRLTLITIILMVPTLVASFYGMNVNDLPLQKSPYAFWFLLGGSMLFSFSLVIFFRSKRMI